MPDAIAQFAGDVFKNTGLQLLLLLGPVLGLAALMHWVSRLVRDRAYDLLGRGLYMALFGWMGTAAHELGHALMAVLFRHRIEEMKLFTPSPRADSLGHVIHSYNRRSLYQVIGNFFIGIGPILTGTALILAASHFLVPETVSAPFRELRIGDEFFQSAEGVRTACVALRAAGGASARALAAAAPAGQVLFAVFLYVLCGVGSGLTLSREDIRGALPGFAAFCLLLLIVNIIAQPFGGVPASAVRAAANAVSLGAAAMALALVLNALLLIPLGLLGLLPALKKR